MNSKLHHDIKQENELQNLSKLLKIGTVDFSKAGIHIFATPVLNKNVKALFFDKIVLIKDKKY